jgi:hypothetical protein
MSYSDPKYYARSMQPAAFALSFGTATAAGTASNTLSAAEAGALPKFKRKTSISAIRMRCTTIPNASATAVIAQFKNGTSVFGTVVLTTATASSGGQQLDGVITSAANAVLAADTRPTVDITGTFTASAGAVGAYDIWFETQEQYAAS